MIPQSLRELASLAASAPQAAAKRLFQSPASPSASVPTSSSSPAARKSQSVANSGRSLEEKYATSRLPRAGGAVTPEQESEQAKMDAFVFFTMMR